MITWLATRLGLNKYAVAGLLTAACLALVALGAWGMVAGFRSIIADAVAIAVAGRDAHWRAEIAAANLATETARAEQARNASRLEAQAAQDAARFQTELNDLEKRNAALADGDRCGLGRDRVRLLNGAR